MTRPPRTSHFTGVTLVLVGVLLCSLLPVRAGGSPAVTVYPRAVSAPAVVRSAASDQLNTIFDSLVNKSSTSDPYYWNGAMLYTTQTTCFRCEAGPAVLAAATWRVTGSRRASDMSRKTFDALISSHRSADGSFGPVMGNETSPDIQTALFANEVGEAYLMLEPTLTTAQRSSWARAVVSAADWLIAHKNLQWYTNGNIALANALTMLLASRLSETRSAYYGSKYNDAMRFAVAPPQGRWKGFGFVTVKPSSNADGSNGAGYLAESGGGTPGLDIDYVQMQSNVLAWLYWVSPSTRNLALLNMTVNELMSHVDKSRWWLQTGGGTRHTATSRWIGLETSSLPMAATRGGRKDLTSDLSSFTQFMQREWTSAATYVNAGTAYAFGSAAALALFTIARNS